MHPRPPERIDSERLILRRWRNDDAPALYRAVIDSRPELIPWLPWASADISEASYRDFVRQCAVAWEEGRDYVYGILALDDRTVLGGTGYHLRRGPDTLEIGYWVHSDHTGFGIASDVTRLLTDTAFALPGIERVVVVVDIDNTRSQSIPERLGFTLVETVPNVPVAPLETGLQHHYEMSRSEWTEHRATRPTGQEPGVA